MLSADYMLAYHATQMIERGWSNRKSDPGGETIHGVSRVWFPKSSVWGIVENWKAGKIDAKKRDELLEPILIEFYHQEFWLKINGDKLSACSKVIASKVFDMAVNLGPKRAIKCLQTAINLQNYTGTYKDIDVDGGLGGATLDTLRRALESKPTPKDINEKIIMACLRGEQYIIYKSRPTIRVNRGLFARI